MGPKQVRLREVVCDAIPGSNPVGIITFDTGHDAVSATSIIELISSRMVASQICDSRKAYCIRGSAPNHRRTYQRVLGLNAARAVVVSAMNRIGEDKTAALLGWLSEQGISPELWPVSDVDAVSAFYPPGTKGDDGRIRADFHQLHQTAMADSLVDSSSRKDNSKLRQSLDKLVLVGGEVKREVVEPSVFPYWITC